MPPPHQLKVGSSSKKAGPKKQKSKVRGDWFVGIVIFQCHRGTGVEEDTGEVHRVPRFLLEKAEDQLLQKTDRLLMQTGFFAVE